MECQDLIEAAEAKAFYGLVINRPFLEALVGKLLEFDALPGKQVVELANRYNIQRFTSPFVKDFG